MVLDFNLNSAHYTAWNIINFLPLKLSSSSSSTFPYSSHSFHLFFAVLFIHLSLFSFISHSLFSLLSVLDLAILRIGKMKVFLKIEQMGWSLWEKYETTEILCIVFKGTNIIIVIKIISQFQISSFSGQRNILNLWIAKNVKYVSVCLLFVLFFF